ncbi:MAG: hypothetical protein PF518_15485 [Spirochaetaceae bacterium]|jgi:hypothetical protein|nr:hypothetical protein [Spirochaetaceae bacterium]
MKKYLITLCLAVFLFVGNVAADSVGENFEAGGIQLGGSGSYYNSLDGYSSFRINPFVNFFVVDNFSFGAGLVFNTNSNEEKNLSVYGSFAYSLVADPSAGTGFVGQMGMGMGYNNDLDGYGYFYFEPYVNAYYYITPRIAPYIGFRAITFFVDEYGFDMSTYINVSFGIVFSIPTKDKVIGGKSGR